LGLDEHILGTAGVHFAQLFTGFKINNLKNLRKPIALLQS